jgi:hypothetical protein
MPGKSKIKVLQKCQYPETQRKAEKPFWVKENERNRKLNVYVILDWIARTLLGYLMKLEYVIWIKY